MTSKPPPPASPAELSRLSRDGLVNKIRYLEKELYRAHAVASANGVTIPPYKSRSPSPSPSSPGENQSATSSSLAQPEKKKKGPKKKPQPFNTRLVALKLAYLGKNYGGFEFQASANVQSVEEVIWRALVRSCLIVPEDPDRIDWMPFQYAKCGRTDKGVSAFGQVISIRLRSSKPIPKPEPTIDTQQELEEGIIASGNNTQTLTNKKKSKVKEPKREWDPMKDEIDYVRTINRLLPPDVRIIAWCPTVPEDFDARFSCGERRYRYFFTQPAFAPLPGIMETEELNIEKPKKYRKITRFSSPAQDSRTKSPTPEPIKRYKEGWLDIEAMREAAKYFAGSHDFRNFCRIDGGKQISEFTRNLFEVTIEEMKDTGTIVPYVTGEAFAPKSVDTGDGPHPKVYSFNVCGNAFLWHQIRCMIAVLFLVGQGLEKPTIVKDLLDVEKYPKKPQYTMADEVPLVLWDCLFPKEGESRGDSLAWIYNSDHDLCADHGAHGMYDHLWTVWRERKMDEILANRLLDLYTRQGNVERRLTGHDDPDVQKGKRHLAKTYRLYEGGNNARTDGRFIPMNKKELQPSFAEVNDAYARRKGFRSSEDMKAGGNWLAEVRARKAAALAAEAEAAGKAAAVAAGYRVVKPKVEEPKEEVPAPKPEPEPMAIDDDEPIPAVAT